mgnify:CR=1 FL=1
MIYVIDWSFKGKNRVVKQKFSTSDKKEAETFVALAKQSDKVVKVEMKSKEGQLPYLGAFVSSSGWTSKTPQWYIEGEYAWGI